MTSNGAEFKSIGGKTQLVKKRPLSRGGSLPSLGPAPKGETAQGGFKQRGFLSEVVRLHQGSEVLASHLGPADRGVLGSSNLGLSKSSSAGSFQISGGMRSKVDGARPVLRAPKTTEVSPKVIEVHAHLPGDRPRKVTVERRKKWFESLDIEDLLVERGVTFRPPNWNDKNWCQLEDFDNTEYDIRAPDYWLDMGYQPDGSFLPVEAKGLRFDEDGSGSWQECVISKVTQIPRQWGERPRFWARWKDHGQDLTALGRLQILFFGEDPELLADRIAFAFQALRKAQSRAKLNFFIDNMPIDDIQCLDVDQIARILDLAKNSAGLRDVSIEPMANDLVREANLDFARTMNKIILLHQQGGGESDTEKSAASSLFDMGDVSVLEDEGENLFEKEVPWFALWPLPEFNFTEVFSNFCFASLYIKPEVVTTNVQVATECLWLASQCLFSTGFKKVMRLDQFRQMQRTTVHQMTHRVIQETWVQALQKIILKNFETVGKGWFSIHETNPDTYRQGKMKKLLAVVRFTMQDTLRSFMLDSVADFCHAIEKYVPDSVTVNGMKDIEQVMVDRPVAPPPASAGGSLDLRPPGKEVKKQLPDAEQFLLPGSPLFMLEIKSTEELVEEVKLCNFVYSSDSSVIVELVEEVLDMGLLGASDVSQLDASIVPQLFKTTVHKQVLSSLDGSDPWVKARRAKMTNIVQKALPPLADFLKLFEKYKDVLALDPAAFVQEKADLEIMTEECKILINEQGVLEQEILDAIPESVVIGLFEISCSEIRKLLAGKYRDIKEALLELLTTRYRDSTQIISDTFNGFYAQLRKVPKDIEGVTEMRDYMASMPAEIIKMQADMKRVAELYGTLESQGIKPTNDDSFMRWKCFGCPKQTHDVMLVTEVTLKDCEQAFYDAQQDEQGDFDESIIDLAGIIESFAQYSDLANVKEIFENVESVNNRLKESNVQAKTFNQREALFGKEVSDYSQLQALQKEWEPFSQLWLTTYHWLDDSEKWFNGPFQNVDAKHCEGSIMAGTKTLFKTVKSFEKRDGTEAVLTIAKDIKRQMDEFVPYVPIVLGLRNAGMRERHWEQVGALCGQPVNPEMENFTLSKFIELGMVAHGDAVADIGDRSGKELNIENQLHAMQKAWEIVCFDCSEAYRTTETYILKGADEVMAILDEQIVVTQAMQFSPFNKPFKEEIDEWNDKLAYVSECLDQWLKVQRAWMYLQPIFDSPDIMKQLPTEGKKFKMVDNKWRSEMNRVHNDGQALKCCTKEGLLQLWTSANFDLDMVQKGLDDYLETKRGAFARFYFLSNDELLEILSQTKDPMRVQPFLCKVFEAMKSLTFTSDMQATQMFSKEGEMIPFVKNVVTKGNGVEVWMQDVELQMQDGIRECIKIGVEAYVEMARTDWVLINPGQVVLQSSQVHWTAEVEEAIRAQDLDNYYTKLAEQLLGLVFLVRGKVNKMQRMSIGALVVIDVHAKDTIEKMAKDKITDLMSFEWISQLRYYWEVDDRKIEHLWVRMVQTPFPYGYEYLGNSFRLVITPLTDMCYMTLMGAQSLNLGGAPAGPAGTGKTETTKDLAKALAKQCVVFNCSPEMDYLMVGKFFKGLSASGAWCCFDEFNRIFIEVLSVIAQQLLVLFSAKKSIASYNETVELEFDSCIIIMRPTFNVFITMNPGYAGRTELPDNLAALFRPMAMMVPDYGMIGEISFYAFGFEAGRHLAKKMVTTFQLCSEQLSAQCHYDYGMRAVKTVIEAAGLNKRKFPDQGEAQILLRALRDVNVPKFLKDDLPLFENIIDDLFPGIERPEMDYGELEQKCVEASRNLGLQPLPYFLKKQFELFDMIQVRHGMMTVGPTGGGKTSVLRCLQGGCSALRDKSDPESPYQAVHIHVLNPKAITQNQLYGSFDEVTREWSDGVAAELIRNAVRDNLNPDHHWVMFDGPVDALWIESMNTVLDDNKKLCLVSGEIIALTDKMRIQFEVEDLEVASPATVSRCGMIYLEPESLGLQPFIDSYCETLPETFSFQTSLEETLKSMLEKAVAPTLNLVAKRLKCIVLTQENNMMQSLCRLLDCYFADYRPTEVKPAAQFKDMIADLKDALEPLFWFCMIWSLGATCDGATRTFFSEYVWGTVTADLHEALAHQMHDLHIACPPLMECEFVGMEKSHSVYDYFYSIEKKEWIPWMDTIPEYQVPRGARYEEIVVPSIDSVRLVYIFQLLVLHDKHVLVPGPTGTGKSANIGLWLQKQAPDNFTGVFISFSAQTHVNQLQDQIDSRLEKRRRGVYGPPAGKKMVLFVDDLNMPLKEYYGAQPPIELLRQWHDHQGWFNRKELVSFKIVDCIMVSAMGPPGGGRTFITERLKRHYSCTTYTELSDDSIHQIFDVIGMYFFQNFEEKVQQLLPCMISSSISIFHQALEDLLPTPSKCHYLFNLRDIWKVFLGVTQLNPKRTGTVEGVARCWTHEVQRVFGDRLTDKADLAWLKTNIDKYLTESFKMDVGEIFHSERLIFASFLTQEMDNRVYEEVTEMKQMKDSVEEYLDDYNQVNAATMPLVMFLDACEHVAKICRVLNQPSGNVLLLGVGGSGRQSLTRLSSSICEADCFQIQVAKGYGMTEFKDDLKKCLLICGTEDKVQIFLFCDTQIVKEDFVEAVNNVLNSGDVPNLYATEDFEAIATSCRKLCQELGMQPTKGNLFAAYLSRVKKNVHVVLAFSPVGDSFRNRLRMFPSLVNCCTIDWFHEWPGEALYSVAKQQITGQQVELPDLEGSLQMFREIHQGVEHEAINFFKNTKRQVYVTPTSYLELLSAFVSILDDKRKEVGTGQHRYQVGLTKIVGAEEQVAGLQQMLIEKKPYLEKTQKEVAEMMIVITSDKAEASKVADAVSIEEAEATIKATNTQAIKDDAQKDLDEALPALEVAVQCLKKLNKGHIQEVKALGNPPAGVRLACEGICIMFGLKPIKKADPDNPGKKIEDYWEVSQKQVLQDPAKLLQDLFDFDKDNIPDKVIQTIAPYMSRDDFDPVAIKKASIACEALCMWARAMYKYHFVAKGVEPKRKMLREAEADLTECQEKLEIAQTTLREVNEKIAKLEADFDAAIAKQDELQADMDLCTVKLERAHKLIGGLGGEKARWGQNVVDLTARLALLPGDCIVAAGMVSYTGPFTAEVRTKCETQWLKSLLDKKIEHDPECSMRAVLGEPVKIQAWVVAALPNDALSIENGIIIDRSRRWALMIDPQRQANKYIKNMGKETETGIDICKLTEKNFLRTMEMGIQFGKWILLENIGISLDPALEPILLQQKVKDGSGYTLKLGDKTITYNETFKLFMTTTIPNPHYSPETSVKVTLLNFAITPNGLEDQMLGLVVAKERPDLEEQKNELIVQSAKMTKTLKEIEDDILKLLASSSGDVLEDDTLVNKVTTSKEVSTDISEKQVIAKETEKTIDVARESYRKVAYRTAVLFFCIVELAGIDPMYQYSLQWFQQLFSLSVDNTPKSDDFQQRLTNLIDTFTENLYQSICRGLFERDKPLFSFALCVRILMGDHKIEAAELKYLLVGPTSDMVENGPKIPAEWVGKVRWNETLTLSLLPAFEGFDKYVTENIPEFKKLYDAVEADKEPMPGHWEEKLTPMQKLCFIRAFRLDNLKEAVINFIAHFIGEKFVDPPTFDIARSYADSINTTPLIFILSPGTDPVSDVIVFADKLGMAKRFESISLGQGQGPKAAKMIENAQGTGGWVLLSNCHLMESWMAQLEALIEALDPEQMSNNFRLWLTSMPAVCFPVQILQNGVKMTNEPPSGLRANLLRSYSQITDELFAKSNKPRTFKILLFSYCFFHAIGQDRRKFGPIGWNIQYGFTPEDLAVCKEQLMTFVNQYEDAPYKVLNFLGAQINYGGRVTDDKDKLLIKTIMETFMCAEAVDQGSGYKFSTSGLYHAPEGETVAEIVEYIKSLPLAPMPEAFGLHANCNITTSEDDATKLVHKMQTMVSLASGGGGSSQEDLMDATAASIQDKMPKPFPLDICEEKFPTLYEESMNTVVKQECLRYNQLLWEMIASLKEFRKALKGLVVMSSELESLGKSLFINEQPEAWVKKGPLSLKPLSSWYLDILARCAFFQMWYDLEKPPPLFWVSGIFFPQAFFTGAIQNYARKFNEEIDLLSYKQVMMDHIKDPRAELTTPPQDGVYGYGMFLEGARWGYDTHQIEDSEAKILFTDVPAMHFVPVKNRVPDMMDYRCPTYKVVSRKGVLLTTGHSTNFVLYIEMKTDTSISKWIKAGMAAFLALKY